MHLRHKSTRRPVARRRIKHYSLDAREVALLTTLLVHWRAAPVPLEGELLKITESLEAKLR